MFETHLYIPRSLQQSSRSHRHVQGTLGHQALAIIVSGRVDPTGEHIRWLQEFAPYLGYLDLGGGKYLLYAGAENTREAPSRSLLQPPEAVLIPMSHGKVSPLFGTITPC